MASARRMRSTVSGEKPQASNGLVMQPLAFT
jgi:hypothetical protein